MKHLHENAGDSINDPGEPGSYQRLIYALSRASTVEEWAGVNMLAHSLLEAHPGDLTLNAIATLTGKVRTLQTAIVNVAKEV